MKKVVTYIMKMAVLLVVLLLFHGCSYYRAERNFAEALDAMSKGDFELAEKYARDGEFVNPKDRKSRMILAWALYKQSEFEKAQRIFSGILAENKKSIGGAQGMAWVLYIKEDYEGAENWFKREKDWAVAYMASSLWKELEHTESKYIESIASDGYYGLGLIKAAQKDYGAAIKYFEKSTRYTSSFTSKSNIWYALADAQYFSRNYRIAAQYYILGLDGMENPEAVKRLFICMMETGEGLDSLKVFERGLLTAVDRRPFLYGIALNAYMDGDAALFSERMRVLAEIDPYYGDTIYIRGAIKGKKALAGLVRDFAKAYFRIGDFKGAHGKIKEYKQLEISDCEMDRLEAWCVLESGLHKEAFEIFKELSKRKGCKKDDILVGGATALIGMGRTERAGEILLKIQRHHPDNIRAKFTLAGLAYMEKDYNSAIGIYSPLLENFSEKEKYFSWVSRGIMNLGWSYMSVGQYEKALTIFSHAYGLHNNPGYPEIYEGLGWSNYYLRKKAASKQAFDAALTLDPDRPSARRGLESANRIDLNRTR